MQVDIDDGMESKHERQSGRDRVPVRQGSSIGSLCAHSARNALTIGQLEEGHLAPEEGSLLGDDQRIAT